MKRKFIAILLVCTAWSVKSQSLSEYLKIAETNYPLLKARSFEVQARKDQVGFAKSLALPSLDVAYQVNFATHNNLTGMATSQAFVPISGPPSEGNVYEGVFGTAGGLLLNWEPITFGQRKSQIESAKAYQSYQEAEETQEIFQHKIRTVHAYLDVVLSYELIKVYIRNVKRAQENVRIVQSLTRSGLRPGVDSALFTAELSRAKIELLNYEKQKESQKILFSELLGGHEGTYSIDSSYSSTLPVFLQDTSSSSHPLIQLSESRVLINQSEKTSVQRTLYPRLSFWGTAYARGSGIRNDGYVNSQDGLSFSRYNYGAGLVLSAPLLRFASVRHQVGSHESLIKAEGEKLNHVKLQLEKQNEVADITLDNAIKIAQESPSYYEAADYSYRGLLSRYNSGLVNYTDLVQAQYVLIKSEADLKKAYLDVWKALLYKAAVRGDITIFLNQLN